MGGTPRGVAPMGFGGSTAFAAGPLTRRPACLRRTGLPPLALSAGADRQRVDAVLYRLYGMHNRSEKKRLKKVGRTCPKKYFAFLSLLSLNKIFEIFISSRKVVLGSEIFGLVVASRVQAIAQ